MTTIVTTDGQTIEGHIQHEDDLTIRLRSSASFDKPLTIQKSNIDTRSISQRSMMPSGMLNACTEEQILDLLAFLIAGGNSKDAAQGE